MATRLRVLAIAAATGRVGYALFIDGNLCDWGMSRKASKSPAHAVKQVEAWIDRFRPGVVVTEDIRSRRKKGRKTNRVLEAIAFVAESADLLDVRVPRNSVHRNKYEEARALGERFSIIKSWVPAKRRIWEAEPRSTIVFEALGLAVQVVDGFERPSAAIPHAG